MFKIIKIVSLMMIGSISLIAKDYPLMQSQEIIIPNKKRTIIELPFEIKDKPRWGLFKLKSDSTENFDAPIPVTLDKKGVNNVPSLTLDKLPPKQPTIQQPQVANPFPKVTEGVNVLEIVPVVSGSFDVTVWGHEKYPVVLNIKVSDDENETNAYFVFRDYAKEEKKIFEGGSHVDSIAEMLYPMYDYKNRMRNEKELCLDGHLLTFPNWAMTTSNNLEAAAHFECSGELYASSRWILTNNNSYPISISDKEDHRSIKENMKAYFRDIKRNIFAIAIDSDKEFLQPGKSVDLYIVTSIINKQKMNAQLKEEEIKQEQK